MDMDIGEGRGRGRGSGERSICRRSCLANDA